MSPLVNITWTKCNSWVLAPHSAQSSVNYVVVIVSLIDSFSFCQDTDILKKNVYFKILLVMKILIFKNLNNFRKNNSTGEVVRTSLLARKVWVRFRGRSNWTCCRQWIRLDTETSMGRRLEKNYSFCEPCFLSLFRP